MRIPFTIIKGKRVPRIIFSIIPEKSQDLQTIFFLMKSLYEEGFLCLDLPTTHHLQTLKELRELTGDDALIGFGHIGVDVGVSLLGKPIKEFESKIISTVARNFIPPKWTKRIFPVQRFGEVLTQREIDRIAFDPYRFEHSLSSLHPKETPFLVIGGNYCDWLLAFGRIDLLREVVSKTLEKGFIPILAGQWATYLLPKAKSLEVAAYAIPIHPQKSLFDFNLTCELVKKFEKPIIALTSFVGRRTFRRLNDTFSLLFNELKVPLTLAQVSSMEEIKRVLERAEKIPSFIPFQKTS